MSATSLKSEDILLLHPPSNYDTHNLSYFSAPPMLEQMLIIIPFSHMLRFWNSLPPTVTHAPRSSVFKRLIEFYVYGSCNILAMLFSGPLLYMQKFLYKKKKKIPGPICCFLVLKS